MHRFDEVYFNETPFDSWITYVLRRITAFTTPLRDWAQTTGIKSWAQFTDLTRRIMRR